MITIKGKKMGKSYNNVITAYTNVQRKSSVAYTGLFSNGDPFLYFADTL